MREITIPTYPIRKDKVLDVLKENNIYVNEYAKLFFRHRNFNTENLPAQINLVLCSLSELGFANGALFKDIVEKANEYGLYLCHAGTGVFLRLSYVSQAKSKDSVLSGTHRSPEGAIIVLSEFFEQDDAFPKGLYLRNVDDTLWLRGYVCDLSYVWSADDVFAFEKMTIASC